LGSSLPVYCQIKQTVKGWILNKESIPGERILSENDLADQFEVSRLTINQVISQLSQEGFLVSKKGKGTSVSGQKNLINNFCMEFTGFMDDLFYQISKSKTKSVKLMRMRTPKLMRDKFKLDEEDEEIMQI